MLQIVEDIKHGLRYLFQTNNSNTLAIVGTGSLGIETVLDNLVEPGDTVLILLNGMWADRVKEIVTRLSKLSNDKIMFQKCIHFSDFNC